MKVKYLIIFTGTFLIGVVFAFGYLFCIRSPRPIAQNPIPLDVTSENQGRRCEDRHRDGSPDNRLCNQLHEQLSEAVVQNDLDAIREAIKKGANVNRRVDVWYTSPLQQAVKYGHNEIAVILLENGADVCRKANWDPPNIWDNPNPTALDIARKNGNESAVDLLMSFGARRCF